MSIYRFAGYVVACDSCRADLDEDEARVFRTKTEAKAAARSAGWTVGRKVLCDDCQAHR